RRVACIGRVSSSTNAHSGKSGWIRCYENLSARLGLWLGFARQQMPHLWRMGDLHIDPELALERADEIHHLIVTLAEARKCRGQFVNLEMIQIGHGAYLAFTKRR